MLERIIAVGRTTLNLIRAALLAVFLGLMAIVVAAYLGAGLPGSLVAGGAGLIIGVMLARRVWFSEPAPVAETPLPEHRFPGIQDAFERIHARQRVLGFLLVSEFVALVTLRFALERDYPTLFGIPRDRLLVWVLLLAAVTLAFGLVNWRCPNCRRNLGGSLSIRQCPRCGIVLRG